DKCKTFVSDLHNPTGFEFWNGGVLVAMAPDILFLKDTDGDDKADVRVRVVSGIDSADTHHTSSSFTLDPGGALYFQEGTFHHTQVETPYGPPERCVNAGVFRYDPRRQKFEVYVTYGFANPHGHVFDRWGQDFIHDGTGAVPYHGALFSGHLDFPAKHGRPPTLYKQRTRPCPGTEILSSAHFPAEIQDNLLVANVIGFQGILQYKINDKGSSFEGVEVEPIVSSTDPSFRPADLEVGPDGALYFTDWQNPIIGHMQHNLRDPSRDRKHGRVYRVTYKGRDLAKPVTIAGAPIDNVLDVLKNPDNRVRYRARIELSGRKTGDVIPAVKKWLGMLDAKDPNYQHHLLEALWVHQHHNVVDVDLLKRLLGSPDFRARAAATRVLCYWRESVPEALVLLKKQAADAHPRVRLEAVRAASFFKEPEAIEIPLISAEHPSDIYLDFTRGETMKALDPVVKAALAKGQTIHFTSDVGARYFLKNLSTEEILKMKRSRAVYLELLFRKGVRDELRREALAGLASDEKKKPIDVLVDAIRGQDELKSAQDESVVFDLVRLLTDRPAEELKGVRGELEKMAKSAQLPVTRQLGFAALIAADGSIDKAWATGVKSVAALHDLVGAMSLVRDPGLRAALYPKVAPLLDQLPDGLGSAEPNKKGTLGRFVRIELEGRRTLTLAEVEVLSGGRNVARAGKATQKNMAHNGPASNAIDGNKNGSYGGGGQTHTQENTPNPWWEVDLGAELPIDAIRIFNRTDGSLGKRLDNFTLKVLDQRRQEVFVQKNNPAPAEQVEFKLAGGGPESTIRRQAMLALTTVRGQEAATFKSLAKFVRDDVDRHAAIRALQRIPTKDWPAEEARPLLDSITGYVRKLPANERTTPAALDAMQLAYALTPLLPVEEARKARRDLGELGVRILRLGTLVDQMLYDKERLIVQAGKPVEIIFENNDLMPHNLVLLQPGSLEEVGLLGEASATDPGALARQFIPKSNKVLLASKLLQPRDVQQLSFTAPKKAGVYPYVCTYPGHWRRMFGALYVVEDLEEYLAGPEAYLAKHPLPIADELLKFNRPRKEWKFEELAGLVEKLEHGRSFANGKQIFSVASCVACHKLNGVGSEFGPDLTKPDPKLKSADILREIVEPSHRINEKFQTFIIETNAGKIHTGLILDEAGDAVKLIENPLAKAAPIVIKKSDIASRTKSPTSIMPKGLLDKLTQEEILDLVAYVLAKGDPKNMLFHGHHDH
ncbi:MAG: HEAT repeat domain-containing protein, partial [Gemmataceae bacterium]